MKKFLVALLTVLSICSLCVFFACNGETPKEKPTEEVVVFDGNGLSYTLNKDGNYSVALGKATELKEITVPNTFNGRTVSTILAGGFKNGEFRKITLPEGLYTIDDLAFSDCAFLTEIAVPNTVTHIGYRAFYNCGSLANINMGDGVTELGREALSMCASLEGFTFPKSIRKISDGLFSGCVGLKEIDIPSNIEEIGGWSFAFCRGLKEIVIPNTVKSMGFQTFIGCDSVTELSVGSGLNAVSNKAFEDCAAIRKVTLGENVEKIGSWAFASCKGLEELVVPEKLKTVGDNAFWGCEKLGKIYYEGSVNDWASVDGLINLMYFGKGAKSLFVRGEEVIDLTIEDLETISQVAFCKTTVERVTIGNGVFNIGNYAFFKCPNLKRVDIAGTVNKIGAWAFTGSESLETITIGNGVKRVGSYAFEDCPVKTATVPSNVLSSVPKENLTEITVSGGETIGNNAFENSPALIKVTLLSGIKDIGEYAFSYCESLSEIAFPNTLKRIGEYAFVGCEKLSTVNFFGTASEWAGNVEGLKFLAWYGGKNKTVFYNGEKVTDIIALEDITEIQAFAFYRTEAEKVIVSEGVTKIGRYAFQGAQNLTEVVLPKSLDIILEWAFTSCGSIGKVFFNGTEDDWNKINLKESGNETLSLATRYYYSETKPLDSGSFWHYVNGEITVW